MSPSPLVCHSRRDALVRLRSHLPSIRGWGFSVLAAVGLIGPTSIFLTVHGDDSRLHVFRRHQLRQVVKPQPCGLRSIMAKVVRLNFLRVFLDFRRDDGLRIFQRPTLCVCVCNASISDRTNCNASSVSCFRSGRRVFQWIPDRHR